MKARSISLGLAFAIGCVGCQVSVKAPCLILDVNFCPGLHKRFDPARSADHRPATIAPTEPVELAPPPLEIIPPGSAPKSSPKEEEKKRFAASDTSVVPVQLAPLELDVANEKIVLVSGEAKKAATTYLAQPIVTDANGFRLMELSPGVFLCIRDSAIGSR